VKIGLVVIGGLARHPADGMIPALHWFVERLARRHNVHAFTIFGSRGPDHYSFLGATIHHAGEGTTRLRTVAAIVAEHRRERFDLLHAFWLVPPGVVAVTAGRLIRRPVLVHVAGGELVNMPEIGFGHGHYFMGRVWTRMALGGADRISAASRPMIEAINRKGFEAERIPLGVDLREWPVSAPRPRVPGQPARLVHVASLNLVKDQSTLLNAAHRLVEAGVDFTLDIVGPDTLAGTIPALGHRLGLSHRLRFHGYLPHDRLRPLVASADLLWITSRHEAGPLVLLEAAVVGVPAVGTAVGHFVEWAPDAAVAVPVGDAEGLARETLELLRDDARRLAIARAAQHRALAHDADWTAARFERLYVDVTSGARRISRSR
jgi:glycosyltransferase involved in cell wall biosynthesis